MTLPADVQPDATLLDSPVAATAPLSTVRPFYWSVRRELWEHRSIYFAPLAAAGVVLFGFLLGMMIVTHIGPSHWAFDPARQGHALVIPYDIAAIAILMTSLIVALVYCLGALHNERRDRSILFWKSLPVSDLTAVLSKASIPLVVLPVVTFGVILGTQLVMLLLNSTALALHGVNAGPLWAEVLLQSPLILPYGLVALALWHAPIYGWLLLVSAWAKRAPFLWAVLPPLALCLVEKIAFDTGHLATIMGRRLMGGLGEAFKASGGQDVIGASPQMDPIGFLSNPGLWIGLAITAAFLAAAVWVRRYREPI